MKLTDDYESEDGASFITFMNEARIRRNIFID